MQPLGLGDELRVVLRADNRPWDLVSLFRERGSRPFSPADTELVAALSTPLGRAVRAHSRSGSTGPASVEPDGPGLLLFGPDGALTEYNDEARQWLAQMPHQPVVPNPSAIGLQLGDRRSRPGACDRHRARPRPGPGPGPNA